MQKILLTIVMLMISVACYDLVSAGNTQTVIVSERVPGAECICIANYEDSQLASNTYGTNQGSEQTRALAEQDGTAGETIRGEEACRVPIVQRKYECTVQTGLAGFQNMFATIVQWFVRIVMLIGVLSIVGLGIAWSLAGGDDAKAKSELKKWGINIVIGLIILFFFRYILQFLAPWIFR